MSIQEGSIGIVIQYTVLKEDGTPENISSANVPGSKKLIFKKPDKSLLTVDAQFVTDGLDGLLKYTTLASSDLTPFGTYKVQASLILANFTGRTFPDLFNVCQNL